MNKLIYFLFFAITLYASTPYKISNLKEYKNLNAYMLYTEDKQNNLSVNSVQMSSQLNQVTKSNFGLQPFAVWTKVQLLNDTSKSRNIILSNIRAGMDKLDVFVIKKNHKTQSYFIGDARPIINRPNYTRHIIIPIHLASNETVTIVSRCQNAGPLEIGWKVMTSKEFNRYSYQESMFFGIFGGVVLTFVFYNLMIFLYIRNYSLLFYVLYGLSTLVYIYSMNGVFYEWQIYNNDFFNILVIPIGLGIIFFLLLFNLSFFKTKSISSKLYLWIYSLAIMLFLVIISCIVFFNTLYFQTAVKVGIVLTLISLITLLLAGIYFAYKRYVGAIFYILGQGSFFIFGIYHISAASGYFETNIIVMHGTMVALTVDLIFLSMALGQQIAIIKKEKEQNEQIILLTSRFASMGQIVGNIAHQWKIPLARLGSLLMELESRVWVNSDNLKEDINLLIPKMKETLHFMDETITEFSEFYKSDNTKISFELKQQIEEIKNLLSAKSITLNASIEIDSSCELDYFGFKNALSQVIMIIIDNALDIATIRKINHPKIKIYVQRLEKKLLLNIEDNCGGIKQMPIDTIFELFTSYETSKNSGMGLAIAKKMIEHKLNGEIFVKNTAQGAVFSIFIPI